MNIKKRYVALIPTKNRSSPKAMAATLGGGVGQAISHLECTGSFDDKMIVFISNRLADQDLRANR
ncbi:hypothetical protein [Falsirhodobacter deserti]|uniref:hypothetical protein n=1 Tax=Falsirhodobacter deserti TaxID=1365611 RepID=UPI000FE2B7A9|nr:hypothetical protein [Falsirhodobacter deserti]